jgi:MFS family permease
VGQAVVAALAAVVLTLVRIPRPVIDARAEGGRPLNAIVRTPRFLVALACGVASYAVMTFMMTSAPVAMVLCNHSVTEATLGLQWHVLAMYVPSFFTGSLVARFGTERIVGIGLSLILASAALAMAGITVWHFWGALALLGVGWNFAFIGATAMVTECYRPIESTKVQAFNDFLIFGTMALASFASGQLLASLGWAALGALAVPIVLGAAAALAGLALRRPARLAGL